MHIPAILETYPKGWGTRDKEHKMTDNSGSVTATTAEDANKIADEVEAEVEETEETFELPEHDWDAIVGDEDASAKLALLAPVMVLFNAANDIRTKYLAMTDTDSAVESYLADSSHKDEVVADSKDKTFGTLSAEIAQAHKLIAKNEALLMAHATKSVQSAIDPEFDEQKARAAYNDKIAAIKTAYNDGVRSFFKNLGHLTAEVSPTGRESKWRATSGYGQLLLNAYKLPKLDKSDSVSSNSATDPAVTAWNKAAKEWGRNNGFTVKDKGALALDLKEAYAKHLESSK